MPERFTTSNGHEIKHPTEKLSAEKFKLDMANEFGIDGQTPDKRIQQLKELSGEGVAILLEYINKGLQGSEDSLMSHESIVRIGDKETIKPEDRYDVFTNLIDAIKATPEDVNPDRVADVLALGVVLLHPFHDGNGRTARAIGLMFRENYDSDDYPRDFDIAVASRDESRARGGFMINGYIPRFPEGVGQSDPVVVNDYLRDLLTEEKNGAYDGPFGQATLHP